MDSFMDPPTMDLYSLDTIQDMVIQLPKREKKEFISKGGFATKTESPTPSFLKASSPPTSGKIPPPPKETLVKLYNDDDLGLREIGNIFCVSASTVHKWMVSYSIPRRESHFREGHRPWHAGRKDAFSKEVLKRMSESHKGQHSSPDTEFKKGHKSWCTGLKLTEEHRDRLSKANIGREPQSKLPPPERELLHNLYIEEDMTISQLAEHFDTCYKVIKRWLNYYEFPIKPKDYYVNKNGVWNKGKKGIYSEESLRSMSEAHIGRFTGEDHPNWKGGHEYYRGKDWYGQRRLARQRDGGVCYMCSANEKEYPKCFDIHHIEPYRISQDNSLGNLMTLCPSCHGKIESITEDS